MAFISCGLRKHRHGSHYWNEPMPIHRSNLSPAQAAQPRGTGPGVRCRARPAAPVKGSMEPNARGALWP